MQISVVEYGIGNIQSVVNACTRLGFKTEIARDGDALIEQKPDRVILPGVGAAGEALTNIRKRNLDRALDDIVREKGVPFLGICVGLQVLADVCEEFGEHRGLGWIPGHVRPLAKKGSGVRLPHVGWNTIEVTNEADPVLRELDGEDFYFVNSNAMVCDGTYAAAYTDYHGRFVSAVRRDHVMAVQFHPEKSSRFGEKLLKAFIDSPECINVA